MSLLSPRLIVNTVLVLVAIGIIAWAFCEGGLMQHNARASKSGVDRDKELRAERGFVLAICGFVIVLIVAILFGAGLAHGRDKSPEGLGRFANADPQIKAWFDQLASKRGPCCSDADGTALSDVDWQMVGCASQAGRTCGGGHYLVRLDDRWIEVPDDAVITVPNRVGRTMVWPIRISGLPVSIRCFMPGAMG